MRPQILFPLFADVGTLAGVGPRFAKLIGKIAGPRLVDLLWHKPVSLLDWSKQATVATAVEGDVVTLKLTIGEHRPSTHRSRPYKIRANVGAAFIDLVFFRS